MIFRPRGAPTRGEIMIPFDDDCVVRVGEDATVQCHCDHSSISSKGGGEGRGENFNLGGGMCFRVNSRHDVTRQCLKLKVKYFVEASASKANVIRDKAKGGVTK